MAEADQCRKGFSEVTSLSRHNDVAFVEPINLLVYLYRPAS
jgi:hypothetical protein